MAQRKPKPPSRNWCPSHPIDHNHRWSEVRTGACKEAWQFQNVCSCGFLDSDEVFGIPPPTDEPATRQRSTPFSLDNPSDVTLLVQRLFDENMDWARTVMSLLPAISAAETQKFIDETVNDERITRAIDVYVKNLAQTSELNLALLVHHCRKAIINLDEKGAVRATALNVLKAQQVTERSQQDMTQVIQIVGEGTAEDIFAGISPETLPPAIDELPN